MTVSYPIDHYQNRYDPAKNYEKHLVRSGKGVQAAEINEVQENLMARQRKLGDAMMKDGNIIDGATCLVDPDTGVTRLAAGEIYLYGVPRDVAEATFTVPVVGIVSIGVRMTEEIITELEDPELLGPADGTRNQGEPGAGRLKVTIAWGWDGDGLGGEFFAIYTVENGILLSKSAPLAMDSVNAGIRQYDVDSEGGNYIIQGLGVSASYDRVTHKITLLVGEGRARVNGYGVELPRGVRMILDAETDLRNIIAEPKVYTPTAGSMRVTLDNGPLLSINQVRYIKQVVEDVTRRAAAGGSDPMGNTSVLTLVAVNQGGTWNGAAFTGGTNYAIGTEVKLTSGEIDWSGSGAEPAPGSAYKCVYQYQTTAGATITAQDDTGFTISGPVTGSAFQVDYTFALPRVDAIVLDKDGRIARIKGVATQYNPAKPSVPATMLRIASLTNTWFVDPAVASDATVRMTKDEVQSLRSMVFDLYDLVSLERLKNQVALSDPSAKRGVFVDSFTNDNQRDAGLAQTLAVVNEELVLNIVPTVLQAGTAITTPQLLPYNIETLVEQPYRTETMLVNPYQAFDPVPPSLTLDPAVDFWTDLQVTQGVTVYKNLYQRSGTGYGTLLDSASSVDIARTEAQIEHLRQRSVGYKMTGMGAGELIASMTFDGVPVTPSATTANAQGIVSGTFTIPAGILAGTKAVVVNTASGMSSVASFTGRGSIVVEERTTTVTNTVSIDPLAQTFTLQESRHVPGVDLWFANPGDRDVLVQIRGTDTGMPNQKIYAQARIKPSTIAPSGTATRVLFDAPMWVNASTEFAIVVLTDSATTSMHVAKLGGFDANVQRNITSQPYQVGTLLSSSNASTWTPHQDKDLAFRLLGCNFTATTRTVALGTVAVTNASDFLFELNVDIPATGANAVLRATTPDGTVYRMTPDTPIALPVRVTGNVVLDLVLEGAAKVSPVMYPGVQFIAGDMQESGAYITRSFAAGATAARISVTFEAFAPGTSSIGVDVQKADSTWQAIALTGGTDAGNGWVERSYVLTGFTTALASTRIRIRETGTTAARPKVRKLRAVATD